jgi:hypothetical protein
LADAAEDAPLAWPCNTYGRHVIDEGNSVATSRKYFPWSS